MAGDGVVIHSYTTTYEGSSITFTCADGFLPSDIITANCTGQGQWSTDPATYMCTTTSTTTTITTRTTINTTSTTNNAITTGRVQYCNVPLNNSTFRKMQNIPYIANSKILIFIKRYLLEFEYIRSWFGIWNSKVDFHITYV